MRTFFSDLASRGPFLIDGSRVYFLSQTPNKDRLYFPRTGIEFGLVHGGDLEELLRFDLDLKSGEVYGIKKGYIEQNVEYPLLNEKERNKVRDKKRIISFIANELMPYMSGHKEDTSTVFGEKTEEKEEKKQKIDEKELKKRIDRTRRDLQIVLEDDGKFRTPRKNRTDYLLVELPENRSLVLDNVVYSLPSSYSQTSQVAIKLDGELAYSKIKPFKPVEKIESKFLEYLSWHLKSDAIGEFTDYIESVHRISLESGQDIEKIINLKEYSEGDIGFLQKEENIYVYQIIPSFAMIDPRPGEEGTCAVFPRCRVGMAISYNGDTLNLGYPTLFEAVWHPFTQYKNNPFQRLCVGKGDGVPGGKYSNVEWVARKLDAAKNLVTSGLTPGSINRHSKNGYGDRHWSGSLDKIFQGRKIKIDEARKRGLLITNNWEWKK